MGGYKVIYLIFVPSNDYPSGLSCSPVNTQVCLKNQSSYIYEQQSYFLWQQLSLLQKKAVVSTQKGKEFTDISNEYASGKGKWMVMFWWPKDFKLPVCPTEIAEVQQKVQRF